MNSALAETGRQLTHYQLSSPSPLNHGGYAEQSPQSPWLSFYREARKRRPLQGDLMIKVYATVSSGRAACSICREKILKDTSCITIKTYSQLDRFHPGCLVSRIETDVSELDARRGSAELNTGPQED